MTPQHLLDEVKARATARALDDDASRAFAVVDALRTPQQATVWGRDVRVAAGWAAFLNGLSSQDAVVCASLAAAEWTNASRDALLDAIAHGVETRAQLDRRLGAALSERGWDGASIVARLAAAAAVGRLLSLDETQLRNAQGIAATEAGGLSAARGTMTQRFHAGKAAMDGLEAAVLARDGFTAAADSIDGRRGLVALLVGRLPAASAPKGNVSD